MKNNSNQNNNREEENHSKDESSISSPDSTFNQTLRNVQGYLSHLPTITLSFSFLFSFKIYSLFSHYLWILVMIFLRFENPFGKSLFFYYNSLLGILNSTVHFTPTNDFDSLHLGKPMMELVQYVNYTFFSPNFYNLAEERMWVLVVSFCYVNQWKEFSDLWDLCA